MKLDLEAKTKEQELVKTYLEDNASEVLAEKINSGVRIKKDGKTLINKKTLDGFMKYASSEARKLASNGANSACVEDKVVYGWAVHYFEEDSIEGTLYSEDGSEYKPAPKVTDKPVIKTVKQKKSTAQISMFDFEEKDERQNEDEQEDNEEPPTQDEINEMLAELAEDEKQEIKQTDRQVPSFYKIYIKVQNQYPDSIVAYRLGDFYEFFDDSAKVTSELCDLTLTGRDCGLENRVPMTGVPYHSADMYFKKILETHKLAVIESDSSIHTYPNETDVINAETGEVISEPQDEIISKLRKILGDCFIVR